MSHCLGEAGISHLFERAASVSLKDVNALAFENAKALFGTFYNRLTGKCASTSDLNRRYLCSKDYILTITKGLSYQLLAPAVGVSSGCVKNGDAPIRSLVNQSYPFLVA